MATPHAMTLKPVSEGSSEMGARIYRNQEKLLKLLSLLGAPQTEMPGWKPEMPNLETVSDAEGSETVLAHNQRQLLIVIEAILTKSPVPTISLKKHLMECGKAAENQAILHANLLKYANVPVGATAPWNARMHDPLGMTAYCYIMHNQTVMLNTIHAKNPDLFVVKLRDSACCCGIQ